MAYTVMAYTVMAYTVMAYIIMASMMNAYIVVVYIAREPSNPVPMVGWLKPQGHNYIGHNCRGAVPMVKATGQ